MYSISDVMNDGLLWIDVETTGTGEDDLLLEVAMRASDMNGIILDDGCSIVMHHDDIAIGDMDKDVLAMHTRNGLIEESLHHGVSVDQAKRILREYVMKTMSRFDVVYLAGYTVSFDSGMIQHHLKGVVDDMQHRMVDVTSFNIIAEHFIMIIIVRPMGNTPIIAPRTAYRWKWIDTDIIYTVSRTPMDSESKGNHGFSNITIVRIGWRQLYRGNYGEERYVRHP